MKSKEKKDLHTKTINEIRKLLEQAKSDLFTMQMDKAKNKLKNTRAIFSKRKDIAIMFSILKEKELVEKMKAAL